jgi:hypothetical protein
MQTFAKTSKANGQMAEAMYSNRHPEAAPAMSGIVAAGAASHDFSRIPIHGGAPAIQTKLTVNEPGDAFEREADRVADQVMRMTSPAIQRACAKCEDEEKDKRAEAAQGVEGEVQVDEDMFAGQTAIFRKATFAAPPAAATASPERLIETQASGEPLSAAARGTMESAFGHDFSQVRIHHGGEAGELSRRLSALAFTHRNHIYFGEGMYNPDAASGKRLLAHELTHVAQQGYAARQRPGAGLTPAAQSSSPTIQRVAAWTAGAVNEVNNLANTFLNGAPVGVTNPMLNSSVLSSGADTRAAIAKPALAFASSATGVNARVGTVPTNTGSFRENVLTAGPWTRTVPKAAVGAAFPTLTACSGAGDSTFRAIGKPTDAAMFAANRRHEDHHANDFHTAFTATIVPWDTALTAAAGASTVFTGANEAAAEAALFAAMGGTANQVADAFTAAAAAAIAAFHATPKGGNVTSNNPQANADCSTSSIESTNPS